MKRLLFLLLFIPCFSFGQNLVPNPSFEDTVLCPNNFSQATYAKGWNVNINTADYFHICGTNGMATPNTFFGYQTASTGNAYNGLASYNDGLPDKPEVIGRKLSIPLAMGQKYYVSFKVNLADNPNCGMDKLGALFTNACYVGDTIFFGNDTLFDFYSMLPPMPVIQDFAHVYSNQIITDTVNWTTISGSFVADSAYEYILIGRFFDEININFTCTDTNFKWTYYYIDDVCVSIDSVLCGWEVGINEKNIKHQLLIYPNPTTGTFTVQGTVSDIQVYDLFGRLVLRTNKREIDMSGFPKGIYMVSVGLAVRKLILH